MTFEGCTSLTSLPAGLSVKRLNLQGCTSLTSLPAGLSVESLNLQGCTSLTSLPAGLSVTGWLKIVGCTALTSLPAGLSVTEWLNIDGCTALTSLPAGLSVTEWLNIDGCTALTSLPAGLSVGGRLTARGCANLTGLPAGLSVEELQLANCTRLTSLPAGLSVAQDLDLRGCTGLTSLPAGMNVGGNLDLSGCSTLTSLPEDITDWPPSAGRRVRVVDLSGSGISQQIRERLAANVPQGMRFHYSMESRERVRGASAALPAPLTLLPAAIAAWWAEQDAGQRAASNAPGPWALSAPHARDLTSFLARLRSTAEYQNVQTRPSLVERTCALLSAMQQSEGLREVCSERISEALQSCGDRVILQMNQVELAMRVHQAEQGGMGAQSLQSLGLGLMKLEIVHKHAAAKCERMRYVDEIEVFLVYETRLRQQLSLPVSTSHMLYGEQVTDRDLRAAAKEANRAADNPRLRAAFFRAWEPWQKHERRQAAAAYVYQALPSRPFAQRGDQEPICAISQEPLSALEEPVAIGPTERPRVYESADFVTWWQEHGKEPAPAPQGPVALADLWRPER